MILLKASEFRNELVWRLLQQSWVATPLAAGIARISQDASIPALERMLDHAIARSPHSLATLAPQERRSTLDELLAYWEMMTLDNLLAETEPKTILSAYAALKLLGNAKADAFEHTPPFGLLNAKDADGCLAIARQHWAFWKYSACRPLRLSLSSNTREHS